MIIHLAVYVLGHSTARTGVLEERGFYPVSCTILQFRSVPVPEFW